MTNLTENMPDLEGFGKELTKLINSYGLDAWSNTADYLLASLIVNNIMTFAVLMTFRGEPYSVDHNWSTSDDHK